MPGAVARARAGDAVARVAEEAAPAEADAVDTLAMPRAVALARLDDLRAIGRGEADVAAARAVEARAVPRAVARAAAAHSGAVVAEEARLALAAPREERAARCRATRGRPFRAPARCRSRTQPVPRAVPGAHWEDESAVAASEARVARALAKGAGAVARAVGRAPREGHGDAAVRASEAGLTEARPVMHALTVR